MNRIDDTVDPAQIEIRIIEQYQGYLRARERSIYQEFLNNRKTDLANKGTPAEAAESLAEQQADDFILTDRARDRITRAAVQNTLQWVQNAKIPLLVDDATASPQDGGTAHRDTEPTVDTSPPPAEALRTILAEIDSAGADPAVAEQAKNLVLEQYQKYWQVRQAGVYRHSVAKRAADLARLGVPAAEAATRARQESDAFILTAKARRMVDSVAANNTNQWVEQIRVGAERQNSNLVGRLAEIYRDEPRPSAVPPVVAPPPPPGPPPTPSSAAGPPLARPSAVRQPTPNSLNPILARIDRAGADSVATEQAKNLVRERYEEYLPVQRANARRQYMEQRTATLLGTGVPTTDAAPRGRQAADAFIQSQRGQRAVSSRATNSVNEWVDTIQERAKQANSNFVNWLARLYRQTHGIPSEPVAGLTRDQRAVLDLMDTVRNEQTAAETRLAALLERHPDLENNGAHHWLTAFNAHRKALIDLSLHYSEGNTADGRPVTSRTDTSDVGAQRTAVRGLLGEIQLAEQFDQIDAVCLRAEVAMPMGSRIVPEIDVVTGGNRVWREAKTNSDNGQANKGSAFEAQARRQLHITYMNRAYWVDGAPPQIKWHFMNGVHPDVQARLEAIRIEDESGRVITNHHIEVIDGSTAGSSDELEHGGLAAGETWGAMPVAADGGDGNGGGSGSSGSGTGTAGPVDLVNTIAEVRESEVVENETTPMPPRRDVAATVDDANELLSESPDATVGAGRRRWIGSRPGSTR